MAEREEPKSKVGNLPRKMQIICKFWMMGNCIKDDKCEYLHNKSDIQSFINSQNSQSTTECPMYSIGFCKSGSLCKFNHTRKTEEESLYADDNKAIDLENLNILPLWYIEYFFEKPINIMFEELENNNKEEIEKIKLDLNINPNIDLFDVKNLSFLKQYALQEYNSNGLDDSEQQPVLEFEQKREQKTSDLNLNEDIMNNEFNNTTETANNELNGNNIYLNYIENQEDEKKIKTKNSDIASRKTSDPLSISTTPIPNQSLLKIDKIWTKGSFELNEGNFSEFKSEIEVNQSLVSENQSNEDIFKALLSKYPIEKFKFRNSNSFPLYNYANYSGFKNFINNNFTKSFDKYEEKENQGFKSHQKNPIFNKMINHQITLNPNKINFKTQKIINIKNIVNKLPNASLFVADKSLKKQEVTAQVKNQNISPYFFTLGKASLNRAEIMKNLLSKSYPNDVYAYKKISILENLNLNIRYFFLRYKTFDLVRFSMETDLIIIPEENSIIFLEALNSTDDVILIYFDDSTKDFYGFSKVKYHVENYEVEEYLQENYNEIIDLYQSQFPSFENTNNSSHNDILNNSMDNFAKKNLKKFHFIKIEWLWKTKLSFDKVEILRNPLSNFDLFINSQDGQEISSDLGYYVSRLMIKRLTKEEVQDYLHTKKLLENEKLETPIKDKNASTNTSMTLSNNLVIKPSNVNVIVSSNQPSYLVNHQTTETSHTINSSNNNFTNKNLNLNEKETIMNSSLFMNCNNKQYHVHNNGYNNNQTNNSKEFYYNQYNVNNKFQKNLNRNFLANNYNLNNFRNRIVPHQQFYNQNMRNNLNSLMYSNGDLLNNVVDQDFHNKKLNSNKVNNLDTNNLLEKFSNVSNEKIDLTRNFRDNLSDILLGNINNNGNFQRNINNINGTSNINDSTNNNNIIVTNISNLQVNISQNSYSNIDSDEKYHKEKTKNANINKVKKSLKSLSRSRSKSPKSKYHGDKKKHKSEKDKKKKSKKSSSRSESKSNDYKYKKYDVSTYKISNNIHLSSKNENKFNGSKYKNSNLNIALKPEACVDSSNKNGLRRNNNFEIFDKNDELNIDKIIKETKKEIEEELYEYK